MANVDLAEEALADLSLAGPGGDAGDEEAAALEREEGQQEGRRRRRRGGGRRRGRGRKLAEAGALVARLDLAPHPEGGYFRETFRDTVTVGGTSTRAASTAILYLLPAGAKSSLHRIDASECWHAYLGGWVGERRRAVGCSGTRGWVCEEGAAASEEGPTRRRRLVRRSSLRPHLIDAAATRRRRRPHPSRGAGRGCGA